MRLRKRILIPLGIVALLFLLREFGPLSVNLYASESTSNTETGPSKKYNLVPFQSTTIQRVTSLGLPVANLENTTTIQVVLMADITPAAWLPLYKSGHSIVIAIFQPYYLGSPIGDRCYAISDIDLTVKGPCSHRAYADMIGKKVEASISSYVTVHLQKKE
jgi:hypothetical protein